MSFKKIADTSFEFHIFTTISHLFACRPTLELTKFGQKVCSITQMHCHWEQTAAKKGKRPL